MKLYSTMLLSAFLVIGPCLNYVFADQYWCDSCKRNVRDCWDNLSRMHSAVNSAFMEQTCRRADESCQEICAKAATNIEPQQRAEEYDGQGYDEEYDEQTPMEPQNYGQYCCDSYGNPGCITPPSPIGADCFCPGQGYGVICQ